jgi:cysteinyl-tRNA synthetase
MSLKMYNTLTRRKEEFISSNPGRVGMYVCGPTTYNFIHLGNARPLVVFDTIRRYLEYRGYQVDYIQNFTDIDDKIINRAREEGEEPNKLAQRYIEEYFQDADALNVQRAKVHPRVSEHLPEIIAMIEGLLEKGYAYQVAGDVYYSVERFAEYGKLSGRSLEDLQAGARVEVDERKHNPMDFALWKAAKEGEPAWASPWGPGRPGWHIECSAMSLKYLGFGFDIHGGGSDLIFPHHENEIAQSEAFAEQGPFCRYWLHNGFITVNQEKMSKSLGNFFLVRDIIDKFPPQVVRFYLLSTHYRSPLDFDDGKLEMSRRSLERLKTSLDLLDELLGTAGGETVRFPTGTGSDQSQWMRLIEQIERSRQEFIEAMDDDFNTARATASLFELSHEINSLINEVVRSGRQPDENESKALALGRQALTETLGVLGLDPAFLRHRIASYSQESTRYCNYSKEKFGNEITVIEPFFLAGKETFRYWEEACLTAEKCYLALLKNKCTPQEARSVLPNSLKTEIVVTYNLREWRHFFRLRCATPAHPQMKQVTIPLLLLFKEKLPLLFDDIEYDRDFPKEHYAEVVLTDDLFF